MSASSFDVIQRAALENEPRAAIQRLIDDCVSSTNATRGRFFLLELAQTAFVQVVPADAMASSSHISLLEGAIDTDDLILREVIKNKSIRREGNVQQQPLGAASAPLVRSRLLVPLVRDSVCVGVIDLDSEQENHFTQRHVSMVLVASVVALLLCEKDNSLRLLKALPTPVDYRLSREDFLDDLMDLIAESSGMPFIALRELKDDSLFCIKAYGLRGRREEDLHLSPYAKFRPFYEAVNDQRTIVVHNVNGAEIQHLIKGLNVPDVKSFIVVPIVVGIDVVGTLSFAVSCEHKYTTLERSGLETIANSVGVGLANYKNFRLAEERVFEEAKIGAAITTVDIAQSARHEAMNHLQACQEKLAIWANESLGGTQRQRQAFRETIEELSLELKESANALQKIKTITKIPQREMLRRKVEDVWHDAFSLVLGRMQQNDIKYTVSGHAEAMLAEDYLRTAFLNLILNSIDAFKQSKRKKGRKIDVTIQVKSEKANAISIRYVDNATGIDPSKLPLLPDGSIREVTDVFLPGITSKEQGSGYGMYLVRKILGDHNGSIDLVDYRGGVVFDLTLPKP